MKIALVFLSGIIIGSFLNVCIYRLPIGMSLLRPRSQCPHCKQTIKFYHNIPLLSFLLLKGRCAYCGQKISWRYFVIELLAGLLAVLAYVKLGVSFHFIFYLVLMYALLVVSVIDLDVKLILNRVLIGILLFGVVINLLGRTINWQEAIIGAVVAGGAMYVIAVIGAKIFRQESMGMGDVKLAIILGFFLGWKTTLIALYLGFVLALIYYVIRRGITGRSDKYIPMAPFFSLSAVILIFWGSELSKWYWNIFIH